MPQTDKLVIKQLDLELNGGCNYKCPMCPQSNGRERDFLKKLPYEVFTKIIDDACQYGLEAVSIHGSGEPLLNRDADKFIKYIKSKSLRCVSFTNGSRLDEEMSIKLIKSGIDLIRISCVGYDRETYKKWMSRDEYETVRENIKRFIELNNDKKVSGILVQLPLPKHIDKRKVIETILPGKDVDGFHPINVGNLSSGYDSSIPCTPLGCYLLLKKVEKNLNGKHAIMIGRSNLNGKPMTQLLLKENCTVTIVHSKTKDLKAECSRADIIIAAVGKPKLVKGDWVKKGAIVIDVGINKTDSGIVGDVDFDAVSKVAKAITPVPGGVGPMTIALLMENTLKAFKESMEKN